MQRRVGPEEDRLGVSGTQFTCFTGAKAQILTQENRRGVPCTQFTCFTGTKVQILTGNRRGVAEQAEIHVLSKWHAVV